MKIALILANNIWIAPYVRIYTRLFDSCGVDYSIISWNRDGNDQTEGFQYNKILEKNGPAGLKEYRGFTSFVKKTIKREGFDHLVVFGGGTSCLLADLLFRFRHRFIIDYRDLSIDQKPGFRQLFSVISQWSYANIISSPGFKKCLPKRDYLISHNFDADTVKELIAKPMEGSFKTDGDIEVLTIGGIRDYDSNIEVVDSLANHDRYHCFFVGKGIASQRIEDYCKDREYTHVSFHGYYDKKDEPGFIRAASFLNIFYPRKISHDTALSNRFYNSLLYKRPMIVTKGTTQGDYADNYQVGVAVENCDGLAERLGMFLKTDFRQYSDRCNALLLQFLEEDKQFKEKVKAFAGIA